MYRYRWWCPNYKGPLLIDLCLFSAYRNSTWVLQTKQNKTFCLLDKLFPISKQTILINKKPTKNTVFKGSGSCWADRLFMLIFTEKMFFKKKPWLWLYIRISIILGSKLNSPEQHGKNNCYQLNRFHCTFEKAENYCRTQGGHLAYTWNQEVQDLVWDFLEEKKWWIGQNLMLLGKYQEKDNPCKALRFSVMKETFLLLFWDKRKKKVKSSCLWTFLSSFLEIFLLLYYSLWFVCVTKMVRFIQSLSQANLLNVSLKVLCKILKWGIFYDHLFPGKSLHYSWLHVF